MSSNIYDKLISKGAIILDELNFEIDKDLPKDGNVIWNGSSVLQLDNNIYYLGLWKLRNSNLPKMEETEAKKLLHLQAVRIIENNSILTDYTSNKKQGIYLNARLRTVVTKDNILFLHSDIENTMKIKDIVYSKKQKLLSGLNSEFNKNDEQELLNLGFKVLVSF